MACKIDCIVGNIFLPCLGRISSAIIQGSRSVDWRWGRVLQLAATKCNQVYVTPSEIPFGYSLAFSVA